MPVSRYFRTLADEINRKFPVPFLVMFSSWQSTIRNHDYKSEGRRCNSIGNVLVIFLQFFERDGGINLGNGDGAIQNGKEETGNVLE